MSLNRKTLRRMILSEIKRSLKETIHPDAVGLPAHVKAAIEEAQYTPDDIGLDPGFGHIIGVCSKNTKSLEKFPNNAEAYAAHQKIVEKDKGTFNHPNVRSDIAIEEESGLYTIHYIIKTDQDEGYVPGTMNP